MLELRAESAVLVLASGDCEEQSVAYTDLLLHIVTERFDRRGLGVAIANERRRRGERRGARREVASLSPSLIVLGVGVFRTRRRLEVDRRPELPGRSARRLGGEVPASVALRVDVADARGRARVRAFVQPADMELSLVRPVDADRA